MLQFGFILQDACRETLQVQWNTLAKYYLNMGEKLFLKFAKLPIAYNNSQPQTYLN